METMVHTYSHEVCDLQEWAAYEEGRECAHGFRAHMVYSDTL
jgi:hypothetical protein